MKSRKRYIYTSLDNFESKNNKVRNFNKLNDCWVEWINERSFELLMSKNKAEIIAGDELRKYVSEVHEQVYFRIRGHSFFLDYYLPKYRMAIEIDGGYHKKCREYDNKRDRLFNSIGVRTIRINSKAVLEGNFIKVLREKLKQDRQSKKKRHKKKSLG